MRASGARVTNRLGFHLRAVTQIAKLAATFQADISLAIANGTTTRRDARSVLDLMQLEAHCGDEVTIEAHGPDEAQAVAAIVALLESRFGEE